MKKIGIIGSGTMGSGIAQKTAQEGLSVVMMDIKPEFVEKGLNSIRETLREAVERRIIKPEKLEEIMGRIRGTTDLSEIRDCDLVIEAVFEDMAVKKELFERLDRICGPGTIIASNTSSFSVDDMSKAFNHPERFLGLHFFYHPAKNRLVEVIPGSKTSKQTIEMSRLYAQLTGKTDILVKDSAGFAVNRIFVPWVNEASRILEEGIANIATIEKAGRESLGLGMGPFELMNITLVKTAFHAASGLADKLGAFFAPSNRLKEQAQSGKPWPLEGEVDEAKLQTVAERLLAVAFFTASSLVQEGVSDPVDTDLGAKVGLRWPTGPFEKMNSIGIDKAYDMVEKLLKRWPKVRMPKNLAIIRQLGEEFRKAERDPETRIIIIETAGKSFVAGADIKFFVDCIKEKRLDDNYAFTAAGQKVLNRIDDSKKLVVAKMDGLALGGGLELALAADVIAATPKAVMGFPETGIGIYPGLGGTQRTSRFIGKELAKYLIFTARIISAQEALDIGLVDYIFPHEQIDEMIISSAKEGSLVPNKGKDTDKLPPEWQKIKALFADKNIDAWLSSKYLNSSDPLEAKTARIIAEKAPIALRLANQIIDVGYKKSLKAGMKGELAHLHQIFSTKDALTGLSNVGKKVLFEGK